MKLRAVFLSVLLATMAHSVLAQEVVQIAPPDNVAAPPQEAVMHSEGLHFVVLQPGTGTLPTEEYIKSLITAWTSADGTTQFNGEESGARTEATAQMREILPGMATAIEATPIGEKRRWWIAANLLEPAWNDFVPGDYTLDIEVIGQMGPLPAPDDVAQVPESATITESGLGFKVLESGEGDQSPNAEDMVTVHYSGWTTDGKMFDSSVIRGEPADFPVSGLIAGMTEGLQLMTLGDTARIWIPKDLAYGDNPRPGAPYGVLVFDVDLIAITPGAAKPAAE